jgi:hypothetical protein
MLGYYRRLPPGAGFAICGVAQPAATSAFLWLAASRRAMGGYFDKGREPVTVKAASDLDCVSCG